MPAAQATHPAPVTMFYSYAHEDEALRDELAGHLKILERRGLILPWHDRQILPGHDWAHTIDRNLECADLVLLLISADFIASDYIFGVELKMAMQRHAARSCSVVPILVRPVDLEPDDAQDLPFLQLQGLPDDLKPVTTWANRDEAWTRVAKGLRKTVAAIQARRPADALATRVPPPQAASARNAAPADALLAQVVQRFVADVEQAERHRGGAPLQAQHRQAAVHEARQLIDLPRAARVLWVDDRPDNNRHERALLAQLQIEVVCVTCTEQTLDRLAADQGQGENFDLVISDWDRPAEGSDAALRLVQALRTAGWQAPVVVYHGLFLQPARAQRAARAQAAGVLGEAVLPTELMALVQKVLVPAAA
jgi:CheY-like chemotaxis protein